MNAAQPSADLLDLIADLIQNGTGAVTMEIGLFTGSPTINVNTPLPDLQALAPTYTGYAVQTVTLPVVPTHDAAFNRILKLSEAMFQPTAGGGTLPNTITGYYWQITVAGPVSILMFAEYFDAPVVLVDQYSSVGVNADVYVRNLTMYGGLSSIR